jgi:hypothetical protein
MLGASDEDQFTWAAAQGRVLVTHDRDFPRLAASTTGHAGLAFAPRQMSIGVMIAGLMLIHQIMEPGEMVGHVEYP